MRNSKISSIFGRTFLILFLFNFCISFASVGQSRTPSLKDTLKSNIVGPLDFKGTVEELEKSIKGAIVTVYEDVDGSGTTLTELKKIVTPGNGEFTIKLEINKLYVIRVEKAGYTMKGIDIDTDVRMARPENTKVPLFEFKVDMVKDLDGLAFRKSVAKVFYQIKRNIFEYELDYTKEEMEEEERLLREQEEKRNLAQLAAQKKFEIEEAAKLLREQDDASMEEKIKAAITIGNNDKVKTIATLVEIFPVSDTLRLKKAELIYTELQKERKKDGANAGSINYKSLFAAVTQLETTVAAEINNTQVKKIEELRSVKLDAEKKSIATMTVQQQALELEMREKIAAANVKDEERKKLEEKTKIDKVYYAIFDSNGDRKAAVAGLIKTFPKGDPYAEKKAEAIYLEYEKTRLAGTTLSKMDFSKLFAAADVAEQAAIKEEIGRADAKDKIKTDAFLKREEEVKTLEQKQKVDAILVGLNAAPKDEASQLAVFVESFPKNDPFRTEKAQAMYEEYVAQKQKLNTSGNSVSVIDFASILKSAPKEKAFQLAVLVESFPKSDQQREEKALAMQEELAVQQQTIGKTGLSTSTLDFNSMMKVAAANKESQLAIFKESFPVSDSQREEKALAMFDEFIAKQQKATKPSGLISPIVLEAKLKSAPQDKASQMAILLEVFPKNDSQRESKAQTLYDEYIVRQQSMKKTGNSVSGLDFGSMFQAAEMAEKQATQGKKMQQVKEKNAEQDKIEKIREEVRQEKILLGEQAAKDAKQVHLAKMGEAKTQKERAIGQALESGAGDRAKTVQAIISTFPKGTELPQLKAEAIYDAYLEEGKRIKSAGVAGAKLDFAVLFQAAEMAELKALERQYEEKQAVQEKQNIAYEEKRIDKSKEVLQEKAKEATKELVVAEQKYTQTAQQVEQDRQARIKEEQLRAQEMQKQLAMEQAKRDALERENQGVVLAKLEAERKSRLTAEEANKERLAAAKLEEQRKLETAAKAEADKLLAIAEKERALANAAKKQTEEEQLKEQAKRDAAALLAKAEADKLRVAKMEAGALALETKAIEEALAEKIRIATDMAEAKPKAERTKEDERLLAERDAKRNAESQALALARANQSQEEQRLRFEAQKAAKAVDLAAANEEADRIEKEKRIQAEADKIRAAEELAKAKIDADRLKEEQRLAAEADKIRIAKELAMSKAESDKAKEEQRLKAEADKLKAAADIAKAKAEADRIKEEQRLEAEIEKALADAQNAEAKAKADKAKEEQRLKAEADKARADAELAEAKAKADKVKEEQRLKAEADKALADAALADAKAKADKAKEEQRLQAERDKADAAAKIAADKAAAEAARLKEVAAAEEAKRKEQEALRLAAADKVKKEQEIVRLLGVAKQEIAKNNPAPAMAAYQQVLALDGANKEAQAGVSASQLALDAIAKADAEKRTLDKNYADLVAKGEKELATGALAEAKKSFTSASVLKPADKVAKDWLAEVKRREDEIAAAAEEKRLLERRYILLMQEGAQAMGAKNLAVAKLRYTEAAQLKPEEAEPSKKLELIAETEQQVALAAEDKRKREEEAKVKFAEQQLAEANRQKLSDAERKKAMEEADELRKEIQQSAASAEAERVKQFDMIKENIEKMNLSAEDQRKAFLSELSKLYPQGITEEVVTGKNYKVLRNVINQSGVVTVYEKRTWDWGGVFWFKNSDIPITESLYKLELNNYSK
jgi:hypothetical protein